MKRLWSVDELDERWTISAGDLAFIVGNADAGRLGLACHSLDYIGLRDGPPLSLWRSRAELGP